jgi:hypothetical protein
VLVKSGGMSQILLWTSFLEIFGGIALFQTIQGKRYPGDFQFDPLGLSQVQTSGVCVCREWRGGAESALIGQFVGRPA